MKKLLILAAAALIAGCTQTKEVVDIYKGNPGQDGTSCSVAPELSEELQPIGSRISCTDGSFSVVLNGTQGIQGIQGVQGLQGIQGPVGQTGAAGGSCQAYRPSHASYVNLQCPGQSTVKIYDGEDGVSCTVSQLSKGARITCGDQVAYVTNGSNGTSCSISNVTGGAKIKCGDDSQIIYDGDDGEVGPTGPPGPQGQPGQNALANAIGIKGYIYPCGQEFANDEVFLRLTDGNILAVYDGGNLLSRLVLLAPGNYVTTDRSGSTCNINVSNNLTVTTSPHAATGLTQGSN